MGDKPACQVDAGQRESSAAADSDYRKPCTLCSRLCDVRIRCQIDETGRWHLVCPGRCWRQVSGGVIDGDGDAAHRSYRYGGVWKNKHDAVSGKKPKKKKKKGLAVPDDNRAIADGGRDAADANGLTTSTTATATHPATPPAPAAAAGPAWSGSAVKYTRNDRVIWEAEGWICRKSHQSSEDKPPSRNANLWKETVGWRREEEEEEEEEEDGGEGVKQ